MAEGGCGDKGGIGDAHAMVQFVFFLDAAQDRNGIFDRGFVDHYRLKTPRKGRVFFHIFAVFVQRGGAHTVQFAPGERGLEQVGRIHCAIGFACADQRVHFVDEQDDFARSPGYFGQNGLQAFFEFATVFGTGNQRTHIQRHQLFVAQGFGHIAIDDAQGQTLGYRGFTHAGFTDQHRVVLGAAAENLHGAANLFIAANDRVDFAIGCGLCQIAGVFLQRVIALLGRCGIGGAALADIVYGRVQLLGGNSACIQRLFGFSGDYGHGHQDAFDRYETVACLGGDAFRLVQHLDGGGIHIDLTAIALYLGQAGESEG